jgi:hypothetical protein
MDSIPHLHVSMPHVEKLADLLVLLPPILSLTSFGTIQGGLACSAELELEIWRCLGSTDDAAPEHDYCQRDWSDGGVLQYSVVDANRSRRDREAYRIVSTFGL